MKFFLLLCLVVSSFSAFGKADPKFCGANSTCVKGYIPVFKSGSYYARAIGNTCQQAEDRAQERFLREFGNIDCGLYSGPFLESWSCYSNERGQAVAWVKCNPDSEIRPSHRAPCALIGGVMVCN